MILKVLHFLSPFTEDTIIVRTDEGNSRGYHVTFSFFPLILREDTNYVNFSFRYVSTAEIKRSPILRFVD